MNNSNTPTTLSLGVVKVLWCIEQTQKVESWVASLWGQQGAAPTTLQLSCPKSGSSCKMGFSSGAGASSPLYAMCGSDISEGGRPDWRGDIETQATALRAYGFPAQRDVE